MIHLTKENYNAEVVKSKSPVIIDFFADWCMPCKMLGPIFEALAPEYEGRLKFVKANIDEAPEIAEDFGVQGVPSLVIVKNGEEITRFVGFLAEEELREKIDEAI